MPTITVIVGEPPYGKERLYTTLRFVLAALFEGHAVNLFLFEDAVMAGKQGQEPKEMPFLVDERMPNCEELLKASITQGAQVKVCGVCAAGRGLTQDELVEGAEISSMQTLVQWVIGADKVVSF